MAGAPEFLKLGVEGGELGEPGVHLGAPAAPVRRSSGAASPLLCDEGVTRYDLGTEMEYKRRWAEEVMETEMLVLVR